MNVLIQLNHPAHYYIFKYVAQQLVNKGYQIIYAVKDKDILLDLLESEKVEYHVLSRRRATRSLLALLISRVYEFLSDDVSLYLLVKKSKPHLMVGTSVSITHVGFLLRIKSLMFNEDDYEINRTCCDFSYPFATKIISPDICSVGPYVNKKIGYNGMQKMAYLSPKYYSPSYDDIAEYVSLEKPFFVIRLVGLDAIHDIQGGHKGIGYILLKRIVSLLQKYGRVLISSEKPLYREFDEFRVKIPPNKIHSLLFYSSLFIGDSQTMCAEAALLGTPYIRYNDFVGKISYLEELESKYELGYGILTQNSEALFTRIKELLEIKGVKELWSLKKNRLFQDKIEVTDWFVDLIESFIIQRSCKDGDSAVYVQK